MAHRPTRAPADAPPFTPTSIPMLGRDWPIYRRDLFGFGLQFRQGPHEQLYFVRVDRKGRVQGKSTPVEQADVARWGGAFAAALKRAYRLVVPATVLSLALSMAVIAQVLWLPTVALLALLTLAYAPLVAAVIVARRWTDRAWRAPARELGLEPGPT